MSIYRGRTRKEFYLASTLYDSIEDRALNSIKSLLSRGADPNLVLAKQGISPFHLAIGCDSNEFAIALTTLILQHGGNPNIRSDDGLTPLHIAAAWGRIEIVQLLLSCGGDPEAKDVTGKSPQHYAVEEGFPECLNLLKSYLPSTELIEKEDCPAANLILDKILVNNGCTIGEYSVVNEYKTDSISKKEASDLILLPETDTTENIINWFNKQVEDSVIIPTAPVLVEKTDADCTSDGFNSLHSSSADESDDEKAKKRVDPRFITFRKVYRKTRKISKENSPNKAVSVTTEAKTTTCKSSEEKSLTNEFTALVNFSNESGIELLPESNLLTTNVVVNRPVDITNKDSSSDYMTCTSASLNTFERNILNETCLLTSDESIFSSTRITKSEEIRSDVSIVSVSEMYKYVDAEEGIVLFERRFLKTPSDCNGSSGHSSMSSKLSSLPEMIDYDTDTLRKELTVHGYNPGPITVTTKRVYLRKLKQLTKQPLVLNREVAIKKVYSFELERTLRDTNWLNDLTTYKSLEEAVIKQFSNPDPSRKWREGVNKSSFTYLLLDPRITNNLPCRAELLQPKEIWDTFVASVFYVGKGKRSRPYSHLYEAVNLWNRGEYKSSNKKLQHILDIWKSNGGVVCLHIFQNIIPVEAYTREAAMINALSLKNVRNIKAGDFYGVAATWPQKQKRMLGVYLLYKAMMIFLNEGERQLCPADIG